MSQWYCHIDGKQYGPVSKEALQGWGREGRIRASDLVWTEGMPAWVPAGSVPGLLDFGGPPSVAPMIRISPGGTGGQTPNCELNAQARESLRGRWGVPIAFFLLLGLLQGAIGAVPYAGGLAQLVLYGPFILGSVIFILTFTRGGNASLGMMFDGFGNFGNSVAACLLMALFVLLWTLLLIVPGIIASLAYSQTFYLLADDRTLGPLAAIRKSKEMMRGYKWKLFCLRWRYVGWTLLCILTLGIGFLWLYPYMAAGYARFYDDLKQPAS